MTNTGIHRIIEQQAAARPDATAIVDGETTLCYRVLNQRANTLARRLAERGLTRGSVAVVRLERSAELVVVLLAVLKAGAAYTWIEPETAPDAGLPVNFRIVHATRDGATHGIALDVTRVLADCAAQPGPNLPVLTRGTDVACVLPDHDGSPHVLVPHATVTSLLDATGRGGGSWAAGAAAFDLWAGLMSGAAITIAQPSHTSAAA